MEVRIENVSKDFGKFPALRSSSLAIKSGELVALLGPSGSGKTTLLRLIAGLEAPSSGSIFFGAEDASNLRVQDRHVGFVFQHYALFKHMTVEQNISFGLSVRPASRRPSRKVIADRARSLLELVQLYGLEKRYPMQLSGGQRQRVALARAMAIEPSVLLLDEPFGALDAQVRKDLRRWLREIHDKTGHTTIFVTHDQEEALELADRVVVMNEGRIEQVGAPDEIYDTPNSPSVFRFIGDSSELPVEINSGAVTFMGRALPCRADGAPDGEACLFFRPYESALVEHGGIRGVVTGSRRLAGVRRIDLKIEGSPHSAEIETPLTVNPSPGDALNFFPRRWALFSKSNPQNGGIYGSTPSDGRCPPRYDARTLKTYAG